MHESELFTEICESNAQQNTFFLGPLQAMSSQYENTNNVQDGIFFVASSTINNSMRGNTELVS